MAAKKSAKAAAKEVDRQLERYRAMRDFAMTAEPSGEQDARAAAGKNKAGEQDALPFVIQKHAATRLHYDFRLGWRGVLKSWAVTKGPSYYPGDKRLAVEVEDHPISYGGFEGTIPKGQYGGGTVMVWDQGTWEPLVDVDEGLRAGRLKFTLHGTKLKGNWALVRMGGRAARESKPNWLLIKEHDKYERAEDAEPITEEAPDSAVTGRDMGAISAAEDHVWQSHKAATSKHPRKSFSAKSADAEIEVDGVRLTHPNKVLDEETGLTKAQLAEYYSDVATVMLRYIAGRPLSLVRCPDGAAKPCFFQKHASSGLPEGVGTVPVKSKGSGKTEQYITIDNAKGLIGLAQMGVMEIHPWGSRNDALDKPDQIIFDLDPGDGIAWEQLVASALEVRDLLKPIGLESFVKATGGKGLHVVTPIAAKRVWEEVKEFARDFARMMEATNPKLYLTKMTKTARKDRIYLDYLRNERGATAVAAYSPRARSGAHVAIPLTWDELKKTARPEFSVANFEGWKARLKRDPWKKMDTLRQSLTAQAVRAVGEFATSA